MYVSAYSLTPLVREFSRDATTGLLTLIGSITTTNGNGLGVIATPDNNNVYVADNNGVAGYSRA